MVVRNLAFPLDEMYDPDVGNSSDKAVQVFHMKATDNGDGSTKRWTNDFTPDRSGTGENAPTPLGSLVDIRVERITERIASPSVAPEIIWQWNERDLSQLTLVKGNGVGGHGTAGDFTLSVTSFPNDDAPAISITNNSNTTNSLIYVFNDVVGPLPNRMQLCFRHLLAALGAMDVGLVAYYEDTTHYFSVRRGAAVDMQATRFNGASGLTATSFGEVADITGNRDTTYGDVFGATVHQSYASGSAAPWWVGKAGGENLLGYGDATRNWRRTAAFTQASANADCSVPEEPPRRAL